MVEGSNDKDVIDIRDQRLNLQVLGKSVRMPAPVRTEKRRPPGQDGPDQAVAEGVHRNLNVVADNRKLFPVSHVAGQYAVIVFFSVPDKIPVPVDQYYAVRFFQTQILLMIPVSRNIRPIMLLC